MINSKYIGWLVGSLLSVAICALFGVVIIEMIVEMIVGWGIGFAIIHFFVGRNEPKHKLPAAEPEKQMSEAEVNEIYWLHAPDLAALLQLEPLPTDEFGMRLLTYTKHKVEEEGFFKFCITCKGRWPNNIQCNINIECDSCREEPHYFGDLNGMPVWDHCVKCNASKAAVANRRLNCVRRFCKECGKWKVPDSWVNCTRCSDHAHLTDDLAERQSKKIYTIDVSKMTPYELKQLLYNVHAPTPEDLSPECVEYIEAYKAWKKETGQMNEWA